MLSIGKFSFPKENESLFTMLDMENQQLGAFVEKARKARRLSYRKLSELSGVSVTMLHKIEHEGITQPSQSTLEGLAKGLSAAGERVSYEELDRIARGLSPYPKDHPGWSPEVEEAIKLLDRLPPDRRKKMLQALEIQLKLLEE